MNALEVAKLGRVYQSAAYQTHLQTNVELHLFFFYGNWTIYEDTHDHVAAFRHLRTFNNAAVVSCEVIVRINDDDWSKDSSKASCWTYSSAFTFHAKRFVHASWYSATLVSNDLSRFEFFPTCFKIFCKILGMNMKISFPHYCSSSSSESQFWEKRERKMQILCCGNF